MRADPAGAGPALAVTDVAATLGGRQVLHDVTLQVGSGEIVGLIGPNGAGKTTLLRAILGLVPATGTIDIAGASKGRGRRRIGYVPQRHEFAWDFPVTVEYAVRSALTPALGWISPLRAWHRAAITDALAKVGLTSLRRRSIGELSGGQRQRVLVARALVTGPGVLLLDEPFTGLDHPTGRLLESLLQELAGSGTALLVTTHDHGAAERICDRICLLNQTIVGHAAPGELTDPALLLKAFGLTTAAPEPDTRAEQPA